MAMRFTTSLFAALLALSTAVPSVIAEESKPETTTQRVKLVNVHPDQITSRFGVSPLQTDGTKNSHSYGGRRGKLPVLPFPEGVNMVMPFPSDNSIIVRGTEAGIAEFKAIVKELDKAPEQISLKDDFVVVDGKLAEEVFPKGLESLSDVMDAKDVRELRLKLLRVNGTVYSRPIASVVDGDKAEVVSPSLRFTDTEDNNQYEASVTTTIVPWCETDSSLTLEMTSVFTVKPVGDKDKDARQFAFSTIRRAENREIILVGVAELRPKVYGILFLTPDIINRRPSVSNSPDGQGYYQSR